MCRSLLTGGLSDEQRRQVLLMIEIWEDLARDRERRIGSMPNPETLWAAGLRDRFDGVAKEPMPDRFRKLLEQLDAAELRGR